MTSYEELSSIEEESWQEPDDPAAELRIEVSICHYYKLG